jgi:hypothetical protein
MKSRTWTWMTAVYLFAALAMPVGMAAQDSPSQDHKPKHHQYRLIDMGTFGGPASYASAGGLANPFLNNRGTVSGGRILLPPTLTPLTVKTQTASSLTPYDGSTVRSPTSVRSRASTAVEKSG